MLLTPPPSPQLKGTARLSDNLVGHILPGTTIELQGVLGIGAYGIVYVARDLSTDINYAVKALNKVGLTSRQASFLEQEIRLHRRASLHPNIVTLIDVIETIETIFVVLDYCPEGDLFGNITEQSRYVGNDLLVKCIFLQLLDAVEYCHSIGVYHRDIKPENILISDGGMTVKLADFGLACTESCSSDFGCGSTFYMSPECLQSPMAFSCYSSAANDVWALGICLINLTCGRNPWKRASVSDPTFAAYLRDSAFLPTILPLSHDLDWILRRIFECEPTERVSISDLRRMIIHCPRFTSRESTVNSTLAAATETRTAYSPERPAQVFTGATHYSQLDFNDQSPPFAYSPASTAADEEWKAHSRSASPISLLQGCSQTTVERLPPHSDYQSSLSTISRPTWYSAFMVPALGLAQKHLSLHSAVFPGMCFT